MLLSELEQIVREEGAVLLGAQGGAIRAEEKTGAQDLVTNYDRLVQAQLERRLRAACPEAGFLGEEGLRAAPDAETVFIIDPIDGTMNFSRGYGRSCICVAMAKNGRAELGVVYDPYRNELFSAARGKGAFCSGRPIHVSDRPLSHGLVMLGTAPYYREQAERTFRLGLRLYEKSLDVRRSGSAAIDLCSVAAGRAEVFYEFLLSPWDYAAAALIIEEAGGIVESISGGEVGLLERSSILAGCPAAFREAREIVREVIA